MDALLAYLDESFDANQYFLGGLFVTPDQARTVADALESYAKTTFPAYGIPFRTEFHGHELFHGTGDWKPLRSMPRARVGIYQDVLDILEAEGVRVRVQRISGSGLAATYATPYPMETVAWWFMLQIVQDEAVTRSALALITADELASAQARRESLQQYRQYGTPGSWRVTRLTQVLDTIHFVPSHHSRLIQAVDMVTFIARRYHRHTSGDPRSLAAVAKLYGTVSDLRCIGPWP